MKNKKYILLLFIVGILYSGNNIFSQSSFQTETYEAFLKNEIKEWKNVTNHIIKKAEANKLEDNLKVLHCYYAYTSLLLDKKEYNTARMIIHNAEQLINKALKKHPNHAELLNYKGVFISYKIPMNKIKAISLGNESIKYIKKALKLDPNNTQILFDNGNAYYYPPKIFGGNKLEALKYYKKAIRIIENRNNTIKNWEYLQMLMLEARCYELLGKFDEAKKGYEKTLKYEPRYDIVKNKLYPGLIKKMNKNK